MMILGILILFLQSSTYTGPSGVYTCQKGEMYFSSDAPLELIEAKSEALKGAVDTKNRTFAFSMPIKSLKGFNSPLQLEHFNENYMDTNKFPTATFLGKIIEEVDFVKEGKYTIRAKGKMTIHGVAQERIIKSEVEVKGSKLLVHAEFTVLLEEHDISIPRIVHQKIAEEIKVRINLEMVPLKE